MKYEPAAGDVVERYEEFGCRLLADETELYRKRLFLNFVVLICACYTVLTTMLFLLLLILLSLILL